MRRTTTAGCCCCCLAAQEEADGLFLWPDAQGRPPFSPPDRPFARLPFCRRRRRRREARIGGEADGNAWSFHAISSERPHQQSRGRSFHDLRLTLQQCSSMLCAVIGRAGRVSDADCKRPERSNASPRAGTVGSGHAGGVHQWEDGGWAGSRGWRRGGGCCEERTYQQQKIGVGEAAPLEASGVGSAHGEG